MPRFYKPPNWRFVVTDLDSIAVTFLDRIAANRVIEYDLNTPTSIAGVVPSTTPEVNIAHTDGDPFLAEGNRLLYAFRREGPVGQPWVIRAAGTILDVDDRGAELFSSTTFGALDPWGYLYSRQCVDNQGELPGELGLQFFATEVGEIALQLLKNTIAAAGSVRLDAGTAWGGTLSYDGFIATTPAIDYNVQRGKTVGEVWEDLCATGLLDLEIVPIYDIDERPGYLGELNVYSQPPDTGQPRGVARPTAIFAWDKPPRTLAGIGRQIRGNERANWIQFYTRYGQLAAGLLEDTASITKYGQQEYVQFFPDQIEKDRVESWASSQLAIRKRGLRSVSPLPSQQQPPLLWDEFFVGDLVPVYASNRIREGIPDFDQPDVYQRVYGITISLENADALEVISDIRVSQDGALSE
ncbi:MAG: hypothetical protein K0S82_38 [Gaiellaceae bacterium]|jgi:hypothetical protein|nr:hypothetical protein [Gaiellaceae bacterium]